MAAPSSTGLRRNLRFVEVVGLSLALMAPSMAANINPQGTAGVVGRAVPLAFLLSLVGVLLLAHSFARLTSRLRHAGSVYGFVGTTLGPRFGVAAGWSLFGTYTLYGVFTALVGASFISSLGVSIGLWSAFSKWIVFAVACVLLAGVAALAIAPVRHGTRILLVAEGVTVLLILIISVVVVATVATGGAPGGQRFTLNMFTVPAGTSTSTIFLGVVFGFLSFAGFEAAATLGEEAVAPRRTIPRAIIGVAIIGGAYFVFVTFAETLGFGTNAAGVQAFTGSGSLMGDLGTRYVAGWLGDVVTAGAAVSAFACSLACTVGAARLAYALSRDGAGPRRLAAVHGTTGAPRTATFAVTAVALITLVVMFAALGGAPGSTSGRDPSFWAAQTGTYILLVVYGLATIGTARILAAERKPDAVVCLLALAFVGYTLWRNVHPYPTGPGRWLPVIAGVWVLVPLAWVIVSRTAARSAGERLAAAASSQDAAEDAERGADSTVAVD